MKQLFPIVFACVLATSALAQDAKTNAAPETNKPTAVAAKPGIVILVSASPVSAPLVLTNGYISQPEQTDVEGGGKAIYNFTITNAGDYVFAAVVNAPEETANSFYLNVDALPEDPTMIWDIDITTGFEERIVSWRGEGSADSDQFAPKKFTLTAGAHKLHIVGREGGCLLKSLTIRPVPTAAK